MTWLAAVPVGLIATAWCVLPGAIIARAAGWRGIACWGAAPLVSIGVIATSAVVASRLGAAWGPWQVAVASLAVAGAALAVRLLITRALRSRSASLATPGPGIPRAIGDRTAPDDRYSGPALLVGMVVTVAIGWMTVVLGFGPVDSISATYDAVHHYSAVAWILHTGDGSSLTLGGLTNPGHPVAYPAAWHDLVALVVMTSGATIPVASNLVAVAVAAVAWPLSCVLLVRQIIGPSAGAPLVTPVLATAFTAMPWMVMTWGVLWPNLLGLALVPAGLAAVVSVLGLADGRGAFGRPGGVALGLLAVPALGFAHPNAAVSLVVLGLSPLLWAAVRLSLRQFPTYRYVMPVAAVAGAVAAVAATGWFLASSPVLDSVRSFDWPAFTDTDGALLGVLWNAMNERPELWVISVLVVIGAVFAVRRASTGWLVPAHITSGFLYLLAASREDELTTALTGAWYNDSYRISAMVPVTGVPLAAVGVLGSTGLLISWAGRLRGSPFPPGRTRFLVVPAAAVVTAGLVLASDGFRIGVHAITLAATYQRDATTMLAPGQRDFIESAGRLLPADAVVAANPWTGNVLLFPLTGHDVTFPHMSGNWTPDQRVVQERLRDAASDPTVCPAARAAGVTHVIDAPVSFWPDDARSHSYPGLVGIGEVPGFEPVLSGGGSTLYRITACDRSRARSTG